MKKIRMKQSHWIEVRYGYKCEKCGGEPHFRHIEDYLYCPFCGRKMISVIKGWKRENE